MDATDWHFYTPERRGAATAPLTDLARAAARHGALSALETLPMTLIEQRLLLRLFARVVDDDPALAQGAGPDTVGQLGIELRHAVDIARLYGGDLYRNASGIARHAYQAALDCLPGDGQCRAGDSR